MHEETSSTGCASLLDLENVDPYPFYEARRQEGPLVWDDRLNAWLVLSYEHCRRIETDEEHFTNPYADPPEVVVRVKGGRSNITLTQGEQHARLRRFHIELLSPAAVADYRETLVRPIVAEMLDRLAPHGNGDLAASLADQVPPRVIIALLGMDWRDDALVERTVHLHEQVMHFIGHNYAAELAGQGLAASAEIDAILRAQLRLRRKRPGDDFISRIWLEAPGIFGEMTEDIAVAICRELYLGGTDTTIHAIANAFYLLLTDADARARVAADPKAAMKPLIEETMRLYGSVQYRYRIAAEDCRLGGVDVRQGQKLVLVHAAANRDPGKYACPHAADFDRRPLADHLAFNMGPRACVGATLARAELAETLGAAIARLPGLRLDPDAPPPSNAGLFLRSFRPLHCLWTEEDGQMPAPAAALRASPPETKLT